METVILLALLALAIINLAFFFFITLKLTEMAKTISDFTAVLDQVVTVSEKIAADVERLWERLDENGLTGAEEQEVYDRIQAALTALQAIDGRTPEPVTPEEPTDPEEPTNPE